MLIKLIIFHFLCCLEQSYGALGQLILHLLMSLTIDMAMLFIAYWSMASDIKMQAQNQPSRQLPHQISQDINTVNFISFMFWSSQEGNYSIYWGAFLLIF